MYESSVKYEFSSIALDGTLNINALATQFVNAGDDTLTINGYTLASGDTLNLNPTCGKRIKQTFTVAFAGVEPVKLLQVAEEKYINE